MLRVERLQTSGQAMEEPVFVAVGMVAVAVLAWYASQVWDI